MVSSWPDPGFKKLQKKYLVCLDFLERETNHKIA